MKVEKVDKTGFPKMAIPDEKKDKQYHLAWAEAIQDSVKTKRSGIDENTRNWFALMRLYGQGNQPQYFYRDQKFGEGNIPRSVTDQDGVWNYPGQGTREGEQHIDYNIISIMPRIKDKLKGMLQNVDYNVLVDNIDSESGAEKEKRKWMLWVQKQHGDFINQFKENADIPVQEPNYLPSSPYELDLFDKVGGFKLGLAKAMEQLIQHTYEISDWDGDLRDLITDDLIDTGYGIGKIDLDPEDGKWKVKYIDVLDAILPYMSRHENFEMPYAGHYEWMTIADLRQHVEEDENKLAELAKQFSGVYDNPPKSRWDKHNMEMSDGSFGYDVYKIRVAHLEWIDESQKKTMYYRNRYGRDSAFRLQSNEEPKPLSDKQLERGVRQRVETTNYRVLRRVSWVVDSKIVFDWGLANFMERPIKNKVVPSYIVVRLKNKPITERLKPVMDDIMVSWLRYQDARAMAIQSGYAIDFSMMQNITDGDKKYSMLDILKMWRDTGILVFQGSLSGRYEGGAVKPVHEITGTAGASLQEAAQMWQIAMQRIEDITGLSPVALGSMPQGNQTATGTELSIAATADILKPLIKKVLLFKERTARSLIRRMQLFAIKDYVDVYAPVIGKTDVERLKQADKSAVQYGLSFEAKPSEAEKQQLIEVINASMNNRRQGMYGIDLATGAWAIEQLNHGANMKEIRMIISYQEEKHRQQLEAEKQQAIEMQGQQNEQLKQIEQQTKQMELQASLAEIQAKGQNELEQVQANLMKEVLVDYMKEHPDEAKRFIGGAGSNSPQNASQMPSDQLSPQSDGNIPPEGESVPTGL